MSITSHNSTRNALRTAIDHWRQAVSANVASWIDTDRDDFEVFELELGPPLGQAQLARWESTHGFRLPFGLKCWLAIADGLVVNGVRWIHPIRCVGPTVRFGPGGGLLQQPASWYEFGNPNDSPVNMDLIFTADRDEEPAPIFVSTAEPEEAYRVVARHFAEWFENVIAAGFQPYWTTAAPAEWVDPVALHYGRVSPPKLSPKLCRICKQVGDQLSDGADERVLMARHGLSRGELESLISAYQYRRAKTRNR